MRTQNRSGLTTVGHTYLCVFRLILTLNISTKARATRLARLCQGSLISVRVRNISRSIRRRLRRATEHRTCLKGLITWVLGACRARDFRLHRMLFHFYLIGARCSLFCFVVRDRDFLVLG